MVDFDINVFGSDFEDKDQNMVSESIEDIFIDKSDFSEHTLSVSPACDQR